MAMEKMAQIALSNSTVFAIAVILVVYSIYQFVKIAVEKNDGDFTLEAKEWNRGAFLRKFIFTFLYSAMIALIIYLMESDKVFAIFYFVLFFFIGLLTPERTREPNFSKSKARRISRYIVSLVLLFLLVYITVTSTASISIKVGAWLILFIIYLLEKIEKKYFISDNTSSHDL